MSLSLVVVQIGKCVQLIVIPVRIRLITSRNYTLSGATMAFMWYLIGKDKIKQHNGFNMKGRETMVKYDYVSDGIRMGRFRDAI